MTILSKDDLIHELRVHQIELELQNEDLRESQIKLSESQNKYFELFNFAPVGYFTLDKDGLISDVNLAGARMLNVPRSNLINRAFVRCIEHDYRNEFHHHINKFLESKTKHTIELKLLKKNDNSFYAHLETVNIFDENGNFKESRITITDITRHKNTEMELEDYRNILEEKVKKRTEKLNKSLEELSNTEKLLSDVTNLSSDIIYVKDRQSRWIFINPALERIVGKTSDDLLGKTDLEIYSNPQIGKTILETDSRIMESGKEETLEEIVETQEGMRSFISVKTPRFNENGEVIGIIGISHDITERKKYEKELKLSERKYHSLYSTMSEGVAIHEVIYNKHQKAVDYIITDINQAYEDITGFKKNDVLGKKASELYGIGKPPYLEKYSPVAENGESILFETFFEPMDKYFSITVTSPEKGKFATFFEDITVRKRAERNLRKSEEKYRSILNNLQDAYIRADKEGKVIIASPSAARMYRFSSPQNMIGIPALSFYKNSEDRDTVLEELNKHGKVKNNETEALRKDGTTFIASQNAQFHYDYQGKIQGTETLVRDITEIKQAEEEILMRRKVLEYINQLFQESLNYETEKEVIEKCLEVAEKLTNSKFGFFGEIKENGRLDDGTLSPPAWDVCETPNAHKLLKDMEIRSYWGRTIKEEKSQIVNNPNLDPDRLGLPEGHPSITSFLGVPLKEGEKTIGMIALVNKNVEYTENDKSNIEALSVAFVEVLMRKRAEIEIQENLKNLAQSNKELEQFAYITSHDLREPLRMITSFLQLLERRYSDNLDQDAKEFIGFAVDGAKRLDNMTNDLLLYSRITSKKREEAPVNFENVMEEALKNLKVPIEESNAVITHDPLPIIKGDKQLNVQISRTS